MIISTHSHLCANPLDLDRLVESGIFEQIWLLHTYYAHDEKHPEELYPKASGDEILSVCRKYRGFFIPFGNLDFRKGPEIVDRLFDAGFAGLKAIVPEKPYDDYSYFPFYERANIYKMPIIFHTGGIAMGKEYVGNGLSFGQNTMKPSMLSAIAHTFPDLTLIGAHLGYPWMEETTNILRCKNVYFDMSEGNGEAIAKWLIENLDRRCPDGKSYTDKILFGVDTRLGRKELHDDVIESVRFWEIFFKKIGRFHNWGRPEEVKKIMIDNAKNIKLPVNPNL